MELKKLIQKPESAVLEFKREYKLKKKAVPQGAKKQSWEKFIEYQSNEFIKDILSLLNRHTDSFGSAPSHLVIGVSDVKKEYFDASQYFISADDIASKLRRKCEPPVTSEINSTLEEIEGKKIWVIQLSFSRLVHELSIDLPCFQGDFDTFLKVENNPQELKRLITVYPRGTVFVRTNAIEALKPDDLFIASLKADKEKIYQSYLKVSEPTFNHLTRNPYKRLTAFTEQDEFFIGREEQTQELIEKLQQDSFVLLTGHSGCGKSSLVFAGVVPELKQQGWIVAQFRPAERSHHLLSSFFRTVIMTKFDSEEEQNNIESKIIEIKQQSQIGRIEFLKEYIQSALDKNESKHFLLIIDQFEELYTHYADEPTLQQEFIDLILGLLKICRKEGHDAVSILITLRLDFIEDVSYHLQCNGRSLLDKYQKHLLGISDRNILTKIIQEPAKKSQVDLEEGLVEKILEDLEQHRHHERLEVQLLLLQFTLHELWKDQENKRLTHKAYNTLGGVKNALIQHAENIYSNLLESEKNSLDYVFLQLINLNKDGSRATRQISQLDDLYQKIDRKLIDKITAHGLLIKHKKTIELPHEALLNSWEYLRQLVENKRDLLVWRNDYGNAVKKWQQNLQNDDLLRGSNLDRAENILKYEELLNESEKQFIQTSLRAKKLTQRRASLIRGVILFFGVISIIAAGLFWREKENVALAQKDAEKQKIVAKEQRNEALYAQSLFLSDKARQELDKGKVFTTMRLGLEALPETSESAPDRPLVTEIQDHLYKAIAQQYNGLYEYDGNIGEIVFNEGEEIFFVITEKAVYAQTIEQGKIKNLDLFYYPKEYKYFGTDKEVFGIYTTHEIKLINLNDFNNIKTFIDKNQSPLEYPRISKKQLLALREDKSSLVIDMITGKAKDIPYVTSSTGIINTQGNRLSLFNEKTNTIELWNVENWKKLSTIESVAKAAYSSLISNRSKFSPNGKWLSVLCDEETSSIECDGDFILVDVETGAKYGSLFGLKLVEDVLFSEDGKKIIAYSSKYRKIALWDIETFDLKILDLQLNMQEHDILSIKADKNLNYFIVSTHGLSNMLSIWDGRKGKKLKELPSHGSCPSEFIDNDAQLFVSCVNSAFLYFYNFKEDTENRILLKHPKQSFRNFKLSKDNKKLIVQGDQSTFLYDVETGEQITEMKHKYKINNYTFIQNDKYIMGYSGDEVAGYYADNSLEISDINMLKYKAHLANKSFINKKYYPLAGKDSIEIYDIESQDVIEQFNCKRCYFLAHSKDQKSIAFFNTDSSILVWNLETKQNKIFPINFTHFHDYLSLELSNDNNYLILSNYNLNNRNIHIISLHTGKEIFKIENQTHFPLSPDNKYGFFSGKLVNINTKEVIFDFNTRGYSDIKTYFSQDSSRLLVHLYNSESEKIELWDLNMLNLVKETEDFLHRIKDENYQNTGFLFSEDSSLLVNWEHCYLCKDKLRSKIYVYDAHTLEKKFELIGHKKAIHSVKFAQDKIVSTSYDREVRVWNMKGQLEFSTFVNQDLTPFSSINMDFNNDNNVMILNFRVDSSSRYNLSTLYNFSTKQRLLNLPPDNYVFTNSGKLVGEKNIIPFFSDRQSLVKYVQNVLPRRKLTCEERQQYFLPILSRCKENLINQ